MSKGTAVKLSVNDKAQYCHAMAENLSMLRTKLGLSQMELGQLIGVSRQAISAFENGLRALPWCHFTSLLFLFNENPETRFLLPVLGIYPPELMVVFRTTSLDQLK